MTAPAPTTCPRCDGEGVVEARAMSLAFGALVEVVCPDCRCPCCGEPSIGLCVDCEDQDWLDAELAYGRSQDQ